MTLPSFYRERLIEACHAASPIAAIEGVLVEARRCHPERFVSAEEERLLLIAREALEHYVSIAENKADHKRRRQDMHTILVAVRRGIFKETSR